jgi:hypothetical protein
MTMLPEDPDLLKWAFKASGGIILMLLGIVLIVHGLGVQIYGK